MCDIDMSKSIEELTQGMDCMERHNFMYKYAEQNLSKGKKGGSCNVTQCQKKGASCYNKGMSAYYCEKCWTDIFNSATCNGLVPCDWILEEHFKEDGHYVYDQDVEEMKQQLLEQAEKENKKESLRTADEYDKPPVSPYVSMFGREIQKTQPWTRKFEKVGRNDSCPCGSGKKYKKCCMR